MQNNRSKNELKPSFLFLIDFSKESYKALDYLIKFTKTINGAIELFYVSETIDSGQETNSLNVLDLVYKEKNQITKKLKALKEIIEIEQINVITTHLFGNLKLELELRLKSKLQTVVIFKNQKGTLGKSVDYLLNHYKGNVLVLNSYSKFRAGNTIAIGCDEQSLKSCDLKLPTLFSNLSQTPIIILQSNELDDVTVSSSYKFPTKQNVEVYYKTINHKRMLDGFKEFINNNNVELLCICRKESNDSLLQRLLKSRKTTNEIVNSIKTPLLIMGK